MKTRQGIGAVMLGACLLHGGSLAAQQSVATYSKEAMDNLVPLLAKAAKDGYSMEPSSLTIYGGWLPRGRAQGTERWISVLILKNLDPAKQYRLIAAGDNDTKDLDLRVLDPSGKIVLEDTATARDAEVTFRPSRVQDYTIQMRLYDSSDNCVCIGAVLRR